MLSREDLASAFDVGAYLDEFYSRLDEPAMQMVCNYLPNLVARLRDCENVLDIGSGPTIHVAVCFRHKAKNIYLSDYLAQNRQELLKWLKCNSKFDWSVFLKQIALQEGIENRNEMENEARNKVKSVLSCDIHIQNVITPRIEAKIDVVTSFCCAEYACDTELEYRNAIRNMSSLLKPGGHLISQGEF